MIGFDPSLGQLTQTINSQNCEFRKGSAEKIEVEDHSVSLLTAAQAAHWFNFSQFYPEAKRVLKKGGVLAIWGYGLCQLNHDEANQLLKYVFFFSTLKSLTSILFCYINLVLYRNCWKILGFWKKDD